jgi:hypothetical protein
MRNPPSDFLLRVAIAFAFMYPAVDATMHPDAWLGFFPPFVLALIPSSLALSVWSLIGAAIALWILSGKNIFLPSLAATVALVLIVGFNFSLMEIVFRDVALAFVALALALDSYKKGVRV